MVAETETPEETAAGSSASVTTNLYTPDTIISPHTCRPYTESNNEVVQQINPFWCGPCEMKLTTIRSALGHLRGKGHRKQLQNTTTTHTAIGGKRKVEGECGSLNGGDSGVKRLRTEGTTTDPATIPENLLKCELCERGFTNPSLALAHFKSKKHTSKLESVFRLNLAKQMKCEKCNAEFTSVQFAVHHYKGKKHVGVVTGNLTAHSINSAPAEVKPGNGVTKQQGDVPADTPQKCDLCSISFTSQLVAHAHFNGKKHLSKLKYLSISNGNGEKQSDWTVLSEA